MEFKVSELVDINKRNLSKNDNFSTIHYLDTANLTEGVVNEVVVLNIETDKIPSRAKRKVNTDDILISTVRPNQKHYGVIKEEHSDYIVSTGFAVLSPKKDKVDPYFLYKFLTLDEVTEELQMIAENSTSAYPSIKPSVIGDITIRLPDLRAQQRIGNFFRDIDDKISTNSKIISTLENLAQTLFKSWFVDFEFPNENGEPYKSSGGEMVESELGMIPKRWVISSLDKIADFQNGLAMQKFRPIKGEESLPVLKIKELREGSTDENSDRCSINIKDTVKVFSGDIIFSWSATLLVKQWYGGNAGLNQHLFKVTSAKYEKWFYYLWTKEHLDRFIAIAADKATTMGHIKRSHLSQSKVVVPLEEDLKKFSMTFQPLMDSILNKGIEVKKLEELRDTLLPKLLSGEIELSGETEVMERVPVS